MTRHVSEEELVDLALDAGAGDARRHAEGCATCASRLSELREGLALARQAEIPEPSPLYWEALRRNVSLRIAEEPRRFALWARLVPLAAAAGLLAFVLAGGGRALHTPSAEKAPVLPSWSALPAESDDPGLAVLEGVAMTGGDLTAWEDGQGIGAFLADLSEVDRRVLVERLQEGKKEGDL
jgi:hypothetical protein